jgi:hypothetical protein
MPLQAKAHLQFIFPGHQIPEHDKIIVKDVFSLTFFVEKK